MKPGWGADWIEWEHFRKFWGQVVNWVLPLTGKAADFDLNVTLQNGKGAVLIDTASAVATHRLTFDVRIARPNTEGEAVELHRITPTQYVGEFSVRERGSYLVTAQKNRDGQVEGTAYRSLVVSYPTEFAEFETNRRLLNELANRTNGIFEPSPKQIAQHSGIAIEHLKPLWSNLLRMSVILFVLEMVLSPSEYCEWLSCRTQSAIEFVSSWRGAPVLTNSFALEAKKGNPDGGNSSNIR